MKFLKRILFFLFALIILLLIVALFVKKDLKAEREIIINKPLQEVYDYVKFLKNQNEYSKWSIMDTVMKRTYIGIDGTIGFISAWDGNKDVGKGEQEIKNIDIGRRIDYELRMEKPMKSINKTYMSTQAINDSTTKVTWGFVGKINYPFNVFNVFGNFNKSIGDDFETGLKKMKTVLEKRTKVL
jgi:hypothetical protein